MAICLDKVSSLALGSVGMSVWQEGCRVFPMCGFAGGFLGMVASLILSKGTHLRNVKNSSHRCGIPTWTGGNYCHLVGDHGLVSHLSSVSWKVKLMALTMVTLFRDTGE